MSLYSLEFLLPKVKNIFHLKLPRYLLQPCMYLDEYISTYEFDKVAKNIAPHFC